MRTILKTALVALVLFVPSAALAADGETALTHVTSLAFDILSVILPIIATWLVHRGIKVFETKTKIDIPASIESQIDTWVEKGIHYASEKSYKKVKEQTQRLSGPEKLEEAADFVFELANAKGWDDWTKDIIKKKIESALGQKRANGGVPKTDVEPEATVVEVE